MKAKWFVIWGVAAIALVALFAALQAPNVEEHAIELPYSTFLTRVEEGAIQEVRTSGSTIVSTVAGQEQAFVTYVPQGTMPDTVRRLYEAGVKISTAPNRQGPTPADTVLALLPMLLLIGAWYFFMRQMQNKAAPPPT